MTVTDRRMTDKLSMHIIFSVCYTYTVEIIITTQIYKTLYVELQRFFILHRVLCFHFCFEFTLWHITVSEVTAHWHKLIVPHNVLCTIHCSC